MTKKCSMCGKLKQSSEFHKATNRKDGLASYCKNCRKKYGSSYFQKNKHKWQWRDEVQKLKRFMQKYENLGQKIENFIGENESSRKILEEFSRRGIIRRPTRCEKCGEKCKPDGHHTDYHRPLYVVWLCKKCHWDEHRK